MLLVNHYVTGSPIHGLGVFTCEPIRAGSLVWKYDPMFDVEIPASLVRRLTKEDALTVYNHAEFIEYLDVFRLGNDGDMFMNHSETPSLLDYGDEMKAARDLAAGSELTCDYFEVCVLGFDEKRTQSTVHLVA